MDFEEFLVKLSETKTKGKIQWLPKRSIRGRYFNRLVCPITGVYSVMKSGIYQVDEFDEAGLELGMDKNLIKNIVIAVDAVGKYDENLRNRILEVLNLNLEIT